MEEVGHMNRQRGFGNPIVMLHAHGRRQRGMVLFVVMIILVVMMLSGVALVRSVDTTSVIAGNIAFKQGALTATDIGVEAASQSLLGLVIGSATESDAAAQNYSATYNPALAVPTQLTASTGNALVDVKGTGNTVRYWVERMCLATGPATPQTCVREENRDSPYYRVTTRVEGPRDTLTLTQSTIQSPGQFVPKHAILTENKLQMSSTISVGGNGGNVHSNTRVDLSGTTVLTLPSGTVSAVGSHAASNGTRGVYNSGTFTGGITENAPAIDIPAFNPIDYAKYADFRLRKDGSVINRLGEVLMTAAQGQAGTKWLGWKYSPPGVGAGGAVAEPGTPPTLAAINNLATWELLDDNSYSTGLLYVEGHALVASSPGNGARGPSPWVISIMATGSVRMNNATFADYRDQPLPRWARAESGSEPNTPPDVPTAQQLNLSPAVLPWPATPAILPATSNQPTPVTVMNLGLVAGLDLFFDGTGSQSGSEALFVAREQVRLNNYNLLGAIIAADKYSINPHLTSNQVNGTFNIVYSELATPAVQGISRRVSWRTVSSLRPTP